MFPKPQNSLFQPINRDTNPNWRQELARRKRMNAKVDWLNRFARKNRNNPYAQKMAMGMYGDMFEQPEDPFGDAIKRAADIATLGKEIGNERLQEFGGQMLTNTIDQYFGRAPSREGGSTSRAPAQSEIEEQKESDYKERFLEQFPKLDPTKGNYERNLKARAAVEQNPRLAEQYFNTDVTAPQVAHYARQKQQPQGILQEFFGSPARVLGYPKYSQEMRLRKAGFNL